MSFALPESMRKYTGDRVATGNDGNISEHIRDLVRRDQEEQAEKRLLNLVEEGLASGSGRRRTKNDERELLAIARAKSIEAGSSATASTARSAGRGQGLPQRGWHPRGGKAGQRHQRRA
jgi:antitoxin ParD1/3/4